MTNEEQNNLEGKQASYGAGKKINRDVLKWVIIGLAGFVVIVLIFSVGIFVGEMKARFSYRWAESYHKNFGGPPGGFLGGWKNLPPFPGDFIEGHGTFGEIIKINDPSTISGQASDFVIKGGGDVEKVIIITKDTIIQERTDTIKKEGLKVGNRVVVIGSPNEEGQIEAKLIRVFNGEDIKDLPRSSRPFFFR